MSVPPRRLRGMATMWIVLLGAGACAPPTPPAPVTSPDQRLERYLSALGPREQKATLATGAALVRVRGFGPDPLPAARVEFALSTPESFRVRVDAVFGTALDAALVRDSVQILAPGRRQAALLDARRDSLGVDRPGALAVRAWAGLWRPPAQAVGEPVVAAGTRTLRWSEAEDSLSLALGADALPVQVRLWRPGATGVILDYERWAWQDGLRWPALFTLRSAAGDWSLQCRVDQVRFERERDPARFRLRLAADTDRLDRAGLRTLLEGGGEE